MLKPVEARTRIASRMKLECERRKQMRGDTGRRTDTDELTEAGERMYELICIGGKEFGELILEKLASLGASKSNDQEHIQKHVALLEHAFHRGIRMEDLPGISAWRRFFDAVSWMYTLANADPEHLASAFKLVDADYTDLPRHLQLLARVMAIFLERKFANHPRFRLDLAHTCFELKVNVDDVVNDEVRTHWKQKKIRYHGSNLTMGEFCEKTLRIDRWEHAVSAFYYCFGDVFLKFLQNDLENWKPQLN